MFTTVLKSTLETIQRSLSIKGGYLMHFDDAEWMHHWYTSQTNSTRKDAKLTYRVDKSRDAVYLTIVSENPFPLKNIERAGMELVEMKEFDIQPGDKVFFRLFCSPAKTQGKKKVLLQSKDERVEWTAKKLCSCMQDICIKEDHQASFKLNKKTPSISGEAFGSNIRVYGWEYQGFATVTDADALKELMLNGIGKFKCYGLGQLLCKKAA